MPCKHTLFVTRLQGQPLLRSGQIQHRRTWRNAHGRAQSLRCEHESCGRSACVVPLKYFCLGNFIRGYLHFQISPSSLIGEACVIDASSQASGDSDYQLTVDAILDWEGRFGQIHSNCIILVNFGWSNRWPDKLRYLGSDTGNIAGLHFPGSPKL